MHRNNGSAVFNVSILILLNVIPLGASDSPNIIFPANCYMHHHQGGQVIDVTQSPYHADPTGQEDCTAKLIAAYDYIVNTRRENRYGVQTTSNIIYLPNGIYKVSNTIVYSGETWYRNGQNGHEDIAFIRFCGQNRDSTIIRLEDNAPGFGAGQAKPVISFGKADMNNEVASNFFENITIHTGTGNPGTVGLRGHGANSHAIRNVNIVSGDGKGQIGLDLPMGSCQGVVKHLQVEGFDYGIHVSNRVETSIAFEFIQLSNQNRAGIHLEDCCISVRKFQSENRVPALMLTDSAGLAVIMDSQLNGLSSQAPAIEVHDGYLYADAVKTAGYACAIRVKDQLQINGPDITKYVYDKAYSVYDHKNTLFQSLPVEETPEPVWEQDLKKWVCVNDFGAKGDGIQDDTEAIRKAMDQKTPIVYFLPGTYLVDGMIEVPAHIERIYFMYSRFKSGEKLKLSSGQGLFKIVGQSAKPLVMEDLFSWFDFDGGHCLIDHASARTLVMRDLHMQRARMYRNSVQGGKVFIENCCNRTDFAGLEGKNAFTFTGQKVWARFIDPEYSPVEVTVDRSDLWVMGFKTEGPGTMFDVRNGGRLMVMGGVRCNYSPVIPENLPIVRNIKSSVICSFQTDGPDINEGRFFKTLITEMQNSHPVSLTWKDVPVRLGVQRTIPLFVSQRN